LNFFSTNKENGAENKVGVGAGVRAGVGWDGDGSVVGWSGGGFGFAIFHKLLFHVCLKIL
jgi:hypothetical protein